MLIYQATSALKCTNNHHNIKGGKLEGYMNKSDFMFHLKFFRVRYTYLHLYEKKISF